MKSAYELAMERLSKSEPTQKLSDEQREALAELNNKYEAKIAERETFLSGRITAAEAAGNIGEADELREQLRRDTQGFKEELEEKKDRIWKQS